MTHLYNDKAFVELQGLADRQTTLTEIDTSTLAENETPWFRTSVPNGNSSIQSQTSQKSVVFPTKPVLPFLTESLQREPTLSTELKSSSPIQKTIDTTAITTQSVPTELQSTGGGRSFIQCVLCQCCVVVFCHFKINAG